MSEKSSSIWMTIAIVCAVLLVGAIVALVVVVARGGDDVDKKALEDKVGTLEEQVSQQEKQIELLEGELAEAEADRDEAEKEAEEEEEEAEVPSDREQLEALGEQVAGDDFHVGEIVIDGDWARVSVVPNGPTSGQGDNVYYHKVNGKWTYADMGTGLQYGDIPGAPESIFP